MRRASTLLAFAFLAACGNLPTSAPIDSTECASCHVPDFRSAKHHGGQTPSPCDRCHSQSTWHGASDVEDIQPPPTPDAAEMPEEPTPTSTPTSTSTSTPTSTSTATSTPPKPKPKPKPPPVVKPPGPPDTVSGPSRRRH